MAKQQTMQAEGFPPPLPAEVQEAADKYQSANAALSKARGKLNTAKENCIEAMTKHGVDVVTFSDGSKDLVLSQESKLKYRKRKKPTDDDHDGE